MFLIENPVVRHACFPTARRGHVVEPARPADAPAISVIIEQHEAPTAAALVGTWWDRHPETFSVARDPGRRVAAFVQVAQLDAIDPQLLAGDPVGRRWSEHLRALPASADDRVLVLRRWLGAESGELRSPAVSSCWLDVERVCLELRPRLRRVYTIIADLPRLAPVFAPLGFVPIGDPVELDGVRQQAVCLDFGPASVDGWLARLLGAETQLSPRPDLGSAAPASSGDLTGREVAVLRLLADGRSNRQIGAALFISEKTASRHVSNIFVKLGVHTRAQAARAAAEHGLLDV
jgi:DNA-binding CsgD family transcriptional regulator